MSDKTPRVPILGVRVNPLDLPRTLAFFEERVSNRANSYVCLAPAHSIMACANDPDLLPVFNQAGLVTPDGMAVVWLLRLKGFKQTRRVYGPDLLRAACAFGLSRQWKHYFYGGSPGVADQLAARLNESYPGLRVTGTCAPPFGRPEESTDALLVEQINRSGADILWVGMSSPWQETWMHEHLGRINVPLMVGVGAAFDFVSGVKPQAPVWAQRSGLEWLFRLLQEPRRLLPRYRQYPRFVMLAACELLSKNRGGEE